VQRPAILLLDETSEGLSPVLAQQLIQVLKRLQAEGITMLLADQNLRFCGKIAARAYVLERGRIQFAGAFDELWKQVEASRMTFIH
jgi:branched-chain amino acid transport system ATP-binding protein